MFTNPKAFVFDLETTGLPKKGGLEMPGIYGLYGAIVDLRDPELKIEADIEQWIRIDPEHEWSKFSVANASTHKCVIENDLGIPYRLEGGGTVQLSYGLDREWLSSAVAMANLRAFLMNHQVADEKGRTFGPMPTGHNVARFDLPVLARAMWRAQGVELDTMLDYHALDTCGQAGFDLAVANDLVDRVRLEKVAPFLGIPYEKGHDAKSDVLMTLEVFRKLLARARREKTAPALVA